MSECGQIEGSETTGTWVNQGHFLEDMRLLSALPSQKQILCSAREERHPWRVAGDKLDGAHTCQLSQLFYDKSQLMNQMLSKHLTYLNF